MIHVFGFCLQSSSSAVFLQVSSEILFASLLVLSADSVYVFADGGTRYAWIQNGVGWGQRSHSSVVSDAGF